MSTAHGRLVRSASGRPSGRGGLRRAGVAAVVVAVLLAGCTGSSPSADEQPPSEEPDTPASGSPDGGGSVTEEPDDEIPEPVDETPLLADPDARAAAWASTIGLPVLGAIRTSTPLARLGLLPEDEWAATCAQVAAELDTIAPPQVLTALAVAADPETATLLVGDLRAKGDLLAVCDRAGDERMVLVEEVADTHEVAVAWLRSIGGQR